MRILFADPDRDLVRIYEKLLDRSGHETVPAFDGIQVLDYLRTERFDAVVLREELPRYETRYLVKALQEMNTPYLILQKEGGCTDRNHLSFPFLPEELEQHLQEVTSE